MTDPGPKMLTEEYVDRIMDAVRDGDDDRCLALVMETLEKGFRPIDVLERGFIPAIQRVGDMFEEGELFLPELMMAGKAMKAATSALTQPLEETFGERGPRPCIVLGTVEGDLHEIGKNIVGVMLETAGFRVLDLGMDVKAEAFVEAATLNRAHIVGASALLTTTMERQRDIVASIRAADPDIKVMVGGAPVTKEWSDDIGADGFAENAHEAVRLARELEEGFQNGRRI